MILNRGIALIQILLITGLLSVFALYLNQGAKQQVAVAQLSQERAMAEVIMHSTKNEVLFNLLTESKQYIDLTSNVETLESDISNNITSKWNFHGQPFSINNNAQVIIQDQAGLINAHGPHLGRFSKLLIKNGVEPTRAQQIIDSLLDWQDADNIPRDLGIDGLRVPIRNAEITDITELEHILTLDKKEQELLYSNLGMYFRGDFNPLTTSDEMLNALTEPEIAKTVMELRKNDRLTATRFRELVDLNADDINYIPANTLHVKYIVAYNQVRLTHEYVIKLLPYADKFSRPIKILMERS